MQYLTKLTVNNNMIHVHVHKYVQYINLTPIKQIQYRKTITNMFTCIK